MANSFGKFASQAIERIQRELDELGDMNFYFEPGEGVEQIYEFDIPTVHEGKKDKIKIEVIGYSQDINCIKLIIHVPETALTKGMGPFSLWMHYNTRFALNQAVWLKADFCVEDAEGFLRFEVQEHFIMEYFHNSLSL